MSVNWDELFNSLPPDELDKLALLRVIECSNGVIQHRFRDNDPDALDVEETRRAMKYSMGAIKTMSIWLVRSTLVSLGLPSNSHIGWLIASLYY